MFEKCANCSTRVVMGKKDTNGIFCSAVCQNFFRYPGFCKRCNASTTEKSAGSTVTMNQYIAGYADDSSATLSQGAVTLPVLRAQVESWEAGVEAGAANTP